mmetsp:Transcript_42034/g.88232  ORF Transcript_42034/g.88232 Transcript_42034/m.88232 type:complete len:431 (-) Transcript_42034:297-1589(-)
MIAIGIRNASAPFIELVGIGGNVVGGGIEQTPSEEAPDAWIATQRFGLGGCILVSVHGGQFGNIGRKGLLGYGGLDYGRGERFDGFDCCFIGGGGGGGGFDRCDNDQDMQVWMNGGEAGRPEHIDFCATQYNSNGCLADSGCMTTCFQETYGYTEGCAECFGAVPICTVIQGCAMLCAADTSSEECTTCNAPCIQTMNECTGLPITPDSDAPTTSSPTTSSPVTSAPTTSAPTTSAPTTSAPTPAPVKGATESPTPSPNTTSPTVNTTPSPSVPDGDGLTDSPTAPDFDDITITTSAPTVKSTPATSAAPSASDAKDGTSPPSSVAQAGTSPPSIAQASNITLSPVPPPSNVTEEETTQEPTDMPTLTPEITYEPTISYEPTGTPTASPIIVAKPDTDRNKESGASIMSSRVGGFSLAVGIMMTMFVGVF